MSTFKLVYLAVLTSLALGLHAFEAYLPVPYLFPGAKLGLANIVALYTLASIGLSEALLVNVLRSVLGGMVSGTFLNIGFFLSFSGAVTSILVMGLLQKAARGALSLMGVSIAGAVTHNVTQLLVASLILRHAGLFFYLPYLLFFAIPTGMFVGFVAGKLKDIGARLVNSLT
ncbi:MAG: Gx transporter family protein [Bacillota bacterium]